MKTIKLFYIKPMEPVDVKPFSSPIFGVLWVLQEWIAILLSFESKKL